MIFLLISISTAAPIIGSDLHLLDRGDISWVENNEQSDNLLTELDGILRPNIRPWFGWEVYNEKIRILGSLDFFYRERIRRIDESDLYFKTGAWRLGADVQTKLTNNKITYPIVGIGIHGNIPTISYNSEIYTEEEQQDYNEIAEQLRSEICD